MRRGLPVVAGSVIDETTELTLDELCRTCSVREEIIIDMVNEGFLEPRGTQRSTWRFAGTALRRVEIALRLQHDLEINLPGAAVIVDLLDELKELRARMDLLERRLFDVD